jgi:hypothetical protein
MDSNSSEKTSKAIPIAHHFLNDDILGKFKIDDQETPIGISEIKKVFMHYFYKDDLE